MRIKKDNVPLKYSQNFLKSSNLADKLIKKASFKKGDLVYEIGPGKGILTCALANAGVRLTAIEKDKVLYSKLKDSFSNYQNVVIKLGDFLEEKLPLEGEYKIFSNIPFSITAQVINKLTSLSNSPKVSYLIIQKEAAKKFVGRPYDKESQYSVLLKPWFNLEIVYHFRRTDFYPVPKVDIVLLRIKKRDKILLEKKRSQLYKDFIVYGFHQRKPNLKKSFNKIFSYKQFNRLSKDLNFGKLATPRDLDFGQWLNLFNYFLVGVEQYKKELVYGSEKKLRHQQSKIEKIHRTRFRN